MRYIGTARSTRIVSSQPVRPNAQIFHRKGCHLLFADERHIIQPGAYLGFKNWHGAHSSTPDGKESKDALVFVHFHRHCHLQFTYELPVSAEGHLSRSKDSRSSNITSIELPPLSIEIVDSRDRVERCDKSHILKKGGFVALECGNFQRRNPST